MMALELLTQELKRAGTTETEFAIALGAHVVLAAHAIGTDVEGLVKAAEEFVEKDLGLRQDEPEVPACSKS